MRGQPQQFDPRQNMRTGDFEIFYYRDAAPGPVAIHHHDFYEIYFLMSGDVTYTIESRLCHVMPGDLLLISPRELHQIRIQAELAAPSCLAVAGFAADTLGCFGNLYGNLVLAFLKLLCLRSGNRDRCAACACDFYFSRARYFCGFRVG